MNTEPTAIATRAFHSDSTMTLRLALEVTTMSIGFDRVPDDVVAKIVENGRAYTGEVKRMAQELMELRAKLAASEATRAAPQTYPYMS